MQFITPIRAALLASVLSTTVSSQPLSCPDSTGNTYTSASGSTFTIECGVDHSGGDNSMATVNSFQGCLDLCASHSWCIDVSYSGVACYMKSSVGPAVHNGVLGAKLLSYGSSSTSTSTTSSIASSTTSTMIISTTTTMVASITSSSSVAQPSCPFSDGISYAVAGGSSFMVECSVDRGGGDLSMVYTNSFAACMTTCSSTSGCVDVSWVPGSPSGPCYMKNALLAPQSNSGVWGARLLTSSVSLSSSSSSTKSSTSSKPPPPPSTFSTVTTTASVSTSIAVTTSVAGCGKPLPAGQSAGGSSTTVSFTQSDGTERSYLIYIPTNYNNDANTPLIFSFHGASATPANQEGLTGFSTASLNPNSIVVYPQGINGYWQGAPYSTAGINDVAFTMQLLASLENMYCVDTNRVYATGFSNGGGFGGLLACDATASNTFAAFGLHSAAFYQGNTNANCVASAVTLAPCNPGRQRVPIIEFHGSADGQIPYHGGDHNGQCLPTIPNYLTAWSVREGYGTANTTTQLGNGNAEYQFGSVQGKAGIVTHYMINGLGHTWASNFNGFSSSPIMLSFLNQWALPLP